MLTEHIVIEHPEKWVRAGVGWSNTDKRWWVMLLDKLQAFSGHEIVHKCATSDEAYRVAYELQDRLDVTRKLLGL